MLSSIYLAGWICDSSRTETEAVPFYEQALALGLAGFDRRDALLALASTYRCLGQYGNSKKTLDSALMEFPDYQPYHVFLALTEFNLSNPDGAIKRLLNLLLESTNDPEILSYSNALKFYSTRLHEVFD